MTARPHPTGDTDTLGRGIRVAGTAVENRASAPPPPADRNELHQYAIVGVSARTIDVAPGVSVPAGTCSHCGMGIKYCVEIQSKIDGHRRIVGTTCAERVGLTQAEVSAMWRAQFDGGRAERDAGWRAERDARDAELAAQRLAAASVHGTIECFEESRCRCDACCAAVPTVDVTVLAHADTGLPVAGAKLVRGRFGLCWVIPDNPDDSFGPASFVSAFPKRRATMVGKGFIETEATFRKGIRRDGGWWADRDGGILRISPVDTWGEPVAGADDFNAAMATPITLTDPDLWEPVSADERDDETE